jgi:hypothetical protein
MFMMSPLVNGIRDLGDTDQGEGYKTRGRDTDFFKKSLIMEKFRHTQV